MSANGDFTEYGIGDCPERCPEDGRYSHKHCWVDGCILYAEGGGGDDGLSIAGYTDGTPCKGCGELVNEKCTAALDGLCWYCDREKDQAIHNEALPILNLQDALEDIKGSKAKLGGLDVTSLDSMRRLVGQLRSATFDLDVAISRRFVTIFDTTIPMEF